MNQDSAYTPGWYFLTNHLRVLALISRHEDATIREIARSIGITERAVSNIIKDLEGARYLTRARNGRRNCYTIHREQPLRNPLHAHRTIGALLAFLNDGAG